MFFVGSTVVVVLVIVIYLNNTLIGKKNKVHEAFSSVDVVLKMRTNLIPKIVNSIKGYIEHERETLVEITQLREQIVRNDMDEDQRVLLENKMNGMLGQLRVAIEAYPNLKASENFLHLQASLNEIEEQLSAARRAYNAAVNTFNNAVEMFPSNLVAKAMGYSQKTMFIIEPSEANPPKVSF